MSTRPTVAILGAGAIGEALAVGLLAAGWSTDDLMLAGRRPERCRDVEASTGVRCLLDPADAADGRDVVVVAVKPADVPTLLEQLDRRITSDQVLLSLAAGVPRAVFAEAFPEVTAIRAMPNTPARIAEAMTVMTAADDAPADAVERARAVLEAVGPTLVLEEDVLDAVTAVSGTGPAYVFLLAEAMIESAIREGIPWHAAEQLVAQTLRGAGMLLAASEAPPARLRAQVTSPGGTTAAAVHVLEERGFRAIVEDAVRAAAQRSREMGESASGQRP